MGSNLHREQCTRQSMEPINAIHTKYTAESNLPRTQMKRISSATSRNHPASRGLDLVKCNLIHRAQENNRTTKREQSSHAETAMPTKARRVATEAMGAALLAESQCHRQVRSTSLLGSCPPPHYHTAKTRGQRRRERESERQANGRRECITSLMNKLNIETKPEGKPAG